MLTVGSAPQLRNGFRLSSAIKNFHQMFFSLYGSDRLLFSVSAFLMLIAVYQLLLIIATHDKKSTHFQIIF